MSNSINSKHIAVWMSLLAILILVASAPEMAHAHGAPFGASLTSGAALSPSGIGAWIFAEQASFYRSLSGYIRASKESGSGMRSLFGISFLYGIFHAAGPGHGKALISSYLVANEETWRRGVLLSFVSAALQSVVAVFVVAVAAVLLGATARSIGATVHIVEIISYGLIILIGVRLLFVKGRGLLIAWREMKRPEPRFEALFASAGGTVKISVDHDGKVSHCARCNTGNAFLCYGEDAHDHHESAWGHAHGLEPAELAGSEGWRRGLSAVVAVGLRPCSGAIIVLIFALAQDVFWTGIGATLVMGFGTAVTVAAIATLTVAARQVAIRIAQAGSRTGRLAMRALEVGASVLIIAFGGLLLAGYAATEQLWTFTG